MYFRQGPRLPVRACAERGRLGVSFREDSPGAGWTTNRLVVGAQRRLQTINVRAGTRDLGGGPPSDRAGARSRPMCWKPRPPISSSSSAVRDRRHRRRHLHHGPLAEHFAAASPARRRRARRSMCAMSARQPPATFPNGCHSPRSSDPQTGVTRWVRYSCVNDFVTVINPMIV